MRFGEASGGIDAEFNPFADDYLGEILEAVAIAWTRMKQPKRSEIEIRITRALAAQLRHDPNLRNLPFDVTPEWIVDNLDAEYLGRLDLHIKHRHSQRDYFAFEAKRLHVKTGAIVSTEYPTYIGDEGMGSFIDGQYSKDLPAAGRLGYVMDADTAKAWNGLSQRIVARRTDLRLSKELADSSLAHHVSKGHPATRLGETLHSLGRHALRLFHLLLPVV